MSKTESSPFDHLEPNTQDELEKQRNRFLNDRNPTHAEIASINDQSLFYSSRGDVELGTKVFVYGDVVGGSEHDFIYSNDVVKEVPQEERETTEFHLKSYLSREYGLNMSDIEVEFAEIEDISQSTRYDGNVNYLKLQHSE